MRGYAARPADRVKGVVATVVAGALIVYGALAGLEVETRPPRTDTEMRTFALAREAPIQPKRAQPVRRLPDRRPAASAAPAGLRAKQTAIVAPLMMPLTPSPPVVTAPEAGLGLELSQGVSFTGTGPGAGGEGVGRGAGGNGAGDGRGGELPPRWRKGRLKDSDYPREAAEAGADGTVSVRFVVEVDGTARDCRVTSSSGNDVLDATTCRLIEQRFRFDPSRDASGRPVRSIIVENHSWSVERDTAPPPERPRG